MPRTALDLITRGLRLAGVLAQARLPGASETPVALDIANAMLDGWDADPLTIYTRRIDAYDLVAGKFSYTIGPGGDFDATRPEQIEYANCILNTVTPVLRRPIEIINDEQWSLIKIQQLPGGAIPLKMYNDGAYPLSTLYLWPGPSLSYQLELYTWQLSQQFSATSDVIVCPPGYYDAMAYNLGVRLAIEWGMPVRPDVAALAVETLATIKAKNLPAPVMSADPAILTSPRGGTFNWLTGN